MDVLGALSGDDAPGDRSQAVEYMLDGARWLGAELDPRYRVLAVTVEPGAGRHPAETADAVGDYRPVDDRRVQVLCHPVATILASLRRAGGDGTQLLAFEHEQLPDVVNTVAGVRLRSPVLGQPEPPPGSWGPRFSMEGRSIAPDGVSQTLRIEVHERDLHVALFARFDVIELRDPTGAELKH